MEVTLENRNGQDALLRVKLTAEDYKQEYDKLLKDYARRMNVPGFRKGMAPAGLVKKMVGPDVKKEVVDKTQQKAIDNYIKENNIRFVLNPLSEFNAEDINWEGNDFEFSYSVGLRPEFSIDTDALNTLTLLKAEPTEEELDTELQNLRRQAAKVEAVDSWNAEDADQFISLTFTELNEDGSVLEGGAKRTKRYSGAEMPEKLREELAGKSKDYTTTISNIGEYFSTDELKELFELDEHGARDLGSFELKVNTVNASVLPEMDQDFFNRFLGEGKASTIEEFREEWRKVMRDYFEQQGRNALAGDVRKKLMETVQMELPQGFMKKYLAELEKDEAGKEEANQQGPQDPEKRMADMTDELKWMMITEKVAEENNLSVSDQEVIDYTAHELEKQFWQMGYREGLEADTLRKYAKDYLAKDNMYTRTALGLRDGKVFEFLISQLTPQERTVSIAELEALRRENNG